MKKSLRKLSALNVKKVFLAFIAVALMLNAQAQLQSALPLDAYGVWDRKAYLPFTDSSHVKTFKGIKLFAKWSGIQAIDSTTYDWSIFDQTLAFADRHGLYTYVGIGVGPECPQWIYDNGVPKMFTNTTELGGIFPYYPDADYKRHYFKLIEALSDYIDGLDQNLKESILFVQARTGCTGDEVPVKGDYLPGSTYQMSDQEWEDFRLESFGKFKQFISDPLNMPLHFNGINYNDPKYVEEWNWVIDNIGTGFGIKGSAYVRGHHLTFENDNKNTWYDMLVNPQELALFSRAEMDQSHTRPLYLINKPLGFYWGVLSGLNTGLSIWDHTQSAIAAIDEYPEIKQSLEFFNRYAPEMYPATTKGAYSFFHEGLNSADLIKFPESVYGTAAKTNEQRYINICAAYAHRGAQMDDPYRATKGQVDQRRNQTGYNDAGWDIPGGNYERWIEQIDPDGTSIGLFRLNANDQGLLDENNSIYDRFARSFETATGKDTMYFKFHEDVFSDTAGQPDVITFELTWLDKNANSTWELRYDAGEGEIKTAYAATGIGDNKWKTKTIALSEAVMNNNCPRSSDFMLVNTDEIDDIFHGFEVMISRKNDENPSSNTRLSDLKVNGETIRRFSPDTKVYNVELPHGTTEVPTVTAIANEPGATINIVDADSLPGSTTITVKAIDGVTTDTYTVYFTVVRINDFVTITSPADGDEFIFGQAVTVTTESHDNDGIEKLRFQLDGVYTNVDDPPFVYTFNDLSVGDHTIAVQMKDLLGNRINTDPLTITVIPDPASDASLSDLLVDGITVAAFSASIEVYNIELPFGTTLVPVVTASSTNTNAYIEVSNAPTLPGTTSILVTAEDGVTSKTYTINFTIAAASTDATLSDLLVNDTTVTDFSASKEAYDIELPEGTSDVPVVTATATDENAEVQVSDAASIPGSTSVLVTAEDGITSKTYTINFTVAAPTVGINDRNVSNSEIVNVYPNPVKEFLNIDFATTGRRKIDLFNSVGQLIYSSQTSGFSTEIDLKPLNIKGLVILQIKSDNSVTNHKLIVE